MVTITITTIARIVRIAWRTNTLLNGIFSVCFLNSSLLPPKTAINAWWHIQVMLVSSPGSCWCCKVKRCDILPFSSVFQQSEWNVEREWTTEVEIFSNKTMQPGHNVLQVFCVTKSFCPDHGLLKEKSVSLNPLFLFLKDQKPWGWSTWCSGERNVWWHSMIVQWHCSFALWLE